MFCQWAASRGLSSLPCSSNPAKLLSRTNCLDLNWGIQRHWVALSPSELREAEERCSIDESQLCASARVAKALHEFFSNCFTLWWKELASAGCGRHSFPSPPVQLRGKFTTHNQGEGHLAHLLPPEKIQISVSKKIELDLRYDRILTVAPLVRESLTFSRMTIVLFACSPSFAD